MQSAMWTWSATPCTLVDHATATAANFGDESEPRTVRYSVSAEPEHVRVTLARNAARVPVQKNHRKVSALCRFEPV
jgi:hypothetical protein